MNTHTCCETFQPGRLARTTRVYGKVTIPHRPEPRDVTGQAYARAWRCARRYGIVRSISRFERGMRRNVRRVLLQARDARTAGAS